MTLYI